MVDVDTIFVVTMTRSAYSINDIVQSIRWTCVNTNYLILVVVEKQRGPELPADDYPKVVIVQSERTFAAQSGFHAMAALHKFIDRGVSYKQVIMLSDTCLITGQYIDSFFLQHSQKDQVGVIGVQTRLNYLHEWRAMQAQMMRWQLPLEGWEQPPISLADDFLVMTPRMLAPLYQRKLLAPEGCEGWRASFGAYISWVCHLIGFYAVSWGYEDKPLPPLFINNQSQAVLPPPTALHTNFLLFAPCNRVTSYSEMDLRELYKRNRGERAREIPRFGPVATGIEQRDAQQPKQQ
jgi:hypothetical protein